MIRTFKQKYSKGLSPLITTILLIVVTFALIGIILGWGKNFTNNTKTTLDSFSETYTKDSTSMIKPIKFYSNNRLVVNDLMSKKDLTITGYRILSDKNLPGLNTTVTLSQPLVLSTGDSTSLIISRPPEKKFDLQLLTNDSKYITVYNIINYPLEAMSASITSPANGTYNDAPLSFSSSISGGDGIYSCLWKVNDVQIHTGCSDFNYSFSSSGTKTISLTASDAENNNSTTTSSLVIYTPLSLSITSPTNGGSYNVNTSLSFSSSISGGDSTYSCLWKDNSVNLNNNCNFTYTYLPWTTKAPMHYARAGLTSSVVNSKIYAIGGVYMMEIVII